MDSPETTIDPEIEVRKLQELVKKLERQNEVLRNKQDNLGATTPNDKLKQNHGDIDQQINKTKSRSTANHDESEVDDISKITRRGHFALDDFDDVDVAELSVETEDGSWLYSSPKVLTPCQSTEKLMSWVRQDFDHPSPDVESSRRALISKLDEVARMKHSSSSPVLGTQPHASRSASALSRSTEEKATHNNRSLLQRKSGLAPPGSGKVFDSGTFTRPKRAPNGPSPMHGEGDHHHDISDAPNAADIENLAKLQEESLRQSMTPVNRKGLREKQSLAEGDNGACHSPSRFDVEGSYLSQQRGSLGSDHSTPPDSPHTNQQFQLHSSNDSRGRRSLPTTNLQYVSHNSSDSSLERHSVNSDDMNLAPEAMRAPSSRLQKPNYRNVNGPQRTMPSNVAPMPAQQPRGVSPQRTSGLPTPRRQIMRPSTPKSSLPMYRRTNVPSPKLPNHESEENWRDGCF